MDTFTKVETKIITEFISDRRLLDSLSYIRGAMEEIWANDAPRIVQDYTDHGVKHSERLAYFVDKLLQAKLEKDFSEQEIYLLFAGIYLHDIGMQCDIVKFPQIKAKAEALGAEFDGEFNSKKSSTYSVDDQKQIRKNHQYLTAAWIDYAYGNNASELHSAIKSMPDDLVNDLMDVCKYHSKLPLIECSEGFKFDPTERKRMVAALLRFADELDIDSNRVSIKTVLNFSLDTHNSVFWWVHNNTKVVFSNSSDILITIRLHPEDFELYNSFIHDEFINKFKIKNQPVMDTLVKYGIPITIASNSAVVEYDHAQKFPSEIVVVLNEQMQYTGGSSKFLIQHNSGSSDIGKMKKLISSETEQESKATISNIPYLRNPRFTGRENKLEQIHEAFHLGKTVAISQPVAVCGLGGIGKTESAVEYTYRYYDEYEFIFWVKADSEDAIVSSYGDIAKLLDLPVKNDSDLNNIVSAVLNWFRIHANWLLVFDNADDISFIKRYLPPEPKGHILLTSRLRVFDTLNITKLIDMEEMSPEEAKSFLLKRTGRTDLNLSELEALEKLVHDLGCLPLALEQAGAYINANNSSFKDYLVSYKIRGLKLLEKSTIDKSKYPESISTTWLMNFEKVKKASEVSADFLFVSAFLNPSEIPSEIFYKGANELGPLISVEFAEADTDPLVFDEILNPLWQYSLINRGAGSHTYNIHRLVQAVLKDGMEESEQKLWAERVVKAVNRAFPEVEYKNWELCDKLLPHSQTCAEYIGLWNIENEESAKLLNATGSYLHKRARFKESEALLRSSLEIRKKILEPEHFDISESLNNLAELYISLGKYFEAEPFFVRALKIRENTLNSDDPAIAESLNNLAEFYRILGRYSEAELLNMNSLKIRETVLKSNDPAIAESLDNLAGVYKDLGRYSEAEPLYIRALETTEKALGTEHPFVGTRLNNLAGVYKNLGRYSEAEPLYTRALEITEKALGPRHPDVGTCLDNLAGVYENLGRYSQAEPLCTRALEITENALGTEHPDVGTRLNNLAGLYEDLGRYSEAESLCVRALKITEKALGTEHPDVGIRLNNLAGVYKNLGRYYEAEPLYTRALEITEKALGPRHPDVGNRLNNLAALYENLGRHSQAEPLYTRALEITENALGSIHPVVGIYLKNIAIFFHNQKKYIKARPFYERAIEVVEKTKGENSLELASLLESYASLLNNMKRNREATRISNRAKGIRSKIEKGAEK
ncbi:tetratricopeptide repeat protein [Methanosarcina sp.]|uniref:tetratricopeptide repeat protein n=1 Tax=Methanosarcina sp. TaxID=2213 RepID=UPI003C78AB8D